MQIINKINKNLRSNSLTLRRCYCFFISLVLISNNILPALSLINENTIIAQNPKGNAFEIDTTNTNTDEGNADTEIQEEKNCNTVQLQPIDFYMASPQTKTSLPDPFSSITFSSLSGNQTKLSELDHSAKNQRLAWSILGYPTVFALTHNGDGKFINVTSSSSPIRNLIGVPSDALKAKSIVLGGYLPSVKSNINGDELFTVGADPHGGSNKPYLYNFVSADSQGTFSRSAETLNNKYLGFANGLDVSPNGSLVLGVDNGELNGIWKSANKALVNASKIKDFTKSYINHFEVDDLPVLSNQVFGVAGYEVPDTYKYSNILSLIEGSANANNQFGFTLFAVDQTVNNQPSVNLLGKADFWGAGLAEILGSPNATVAGLKVKNNYLFISYFINNGIDFKKFYTENSPKYKTWIDPVTGLPPSAFSYKDGLFDSRLAVFKFDLSENKIKLIKVANLSTVFDSPSCSGKSYGVSGPIEVSSQGLIFVADKIYSNVIRAFKMDPSSISQVVPASTPVVIPLSSPRVLEVLSTSKYKPIGNDFSFSTSISDIAIDPNSRVLFVSFPYIESEPSSPGNIHVNGFLSTVYISDSQDKCSNIYSSDSCDSDASSKKKDKTPKDENQNNDQNVVSEKPAIKKTFKKLTIHELGTKLGLPTVEIKMPVGTSSVDNSATYNKGFKTVDLDVSSESNSPNDVRISVGARGVDFASLIQLKPTTPGTPAYPLLKRDVVSISSTNSARAGIDTFGRAVTLLPSNKIVALSSGNKIFANRTDEAVLQSDFKSEETSPGIVSSIPQTNNRFAVLNSPADSSMPESSSITFFSLEKDVSPVTLKDALGKIEDQSVTVQAKVPYSLKFKTNSLEISQAKSKQNQNQLLGLSYYAHNLKSKGIKYYLDKALSQNPNFTQDNESNLQNLLSTFQGFSIFSVPSANNLESSDEVKLNTSKNFYINELPEQLKSPSESIKRFIAGATLFQNPRTKETYIAVSSYDAKVAGLVQVQSAPKKYDSGIYSTVKPPGLVNRNLIYNLDAKSLSGGGKTAKDAAKEGISSWSDLSGSGLNAVLKNVENHDWVGDGTPAKPYALTFDSIDNFVSVPQSALDSIRRTNSYTVELVFNVDSSHKDFVSLFSRGLDQRILLDVNNTVIVNTFNKDTTNTGVIVNPNEWHHIALSKDESNLAKLYLDGKLVWQEAKSKVFDKSKPISIGASLSTNPYFFAGQIASVRVYNSALNDTEVKQNYDTELFRFNDVETIVALQGIEQPKARKAITANRANTAPVLTQVPEQIVNDNETFLPFFAPASDVDNDPLTFVITMVGPLLGFNSKTANGDPGEKTLNLDLNDPAGYFSDRKRMEDLENDAFKNRVSFSPHRPIAPSLYLLSGFRPQSYFEAPSLSSNLENIKLVSESRPIAPSPYRPTLFLDGGYFSSYKITQDEIRKVQVGGMCSSNSDCMAYACNTGAGFCYGNCTDSSQCASGFACFLGSGPGDHTCIVNPSGGNCNPGCGGSNKCCTSSNQCEVCCANSDCPSGFECIGSTCLPRTSCMVDSDCPGNNPICSNGSCVQCTINADCGNGHQCIGYTCIAICGNGTVDNSGEPCDDGNTVNDDYCTNDCMSAYCGDGIVQDIASEDCDDGNTVDNDGCSSMCESEGIPCMSDGDCPANKSVCHNDICVECTSQNNPCVSPTLYCSGDNTCVECSQDSHCMDGRACDGTNHCYTACSTDSECASGYQCDTVIEPTGNCVPNGAPNGTQCDANSDCQSGTCCGDGLTANACGDCCSGLNCGTDALCINNQCHGGSGICMADGECSANSEGHICRVSNLCGCDADTDCPMESLCNVATHKCSANGGGNLCMSNSECTNGNVCCSGSCNQCCGNGDCPAERPHCAGLICLECVTDTDCMSGEICASGGSCQQTCTNTSECGASAVCSGGLCYSDDGPWRYCTGENGTCNETGLIRYGAMGQYHTMVSTGSVSCHNSTFGDPIVGEPKHCYFCPTGNCCISSSTCMSGESCINNKCEESCTTDNDCQPGESCADSMCGKTCTTDTDCPGGFTCNMATACYESCIDGDQCANGYGCLPNATCMQLCTFNTDCTGPGQGNQCSTSCTDANNGAATCCDGNGMNGSSCSTNSDCQSGSCCSDGIGSTVCGDCCQGLNCSPGQFCENNMCVNDGGGNPNQGTGPNCCFRIIDQGDGSGHEAKNFMCNGTQLSWENGDGTYTHHFPKYNTNGVLPDKQCYGSGNGGGCDGCTSLDLNSMGDYDVRVCSNIPFDPTNTDGVGLIFKSGSNVNCDAGNNCTSCTTENDCPGGSAALCLNKFCLLNSWEEVGMDALPVSLRDSAAISFNNKLWIIGGVATPREVWNSSDDGSTWTEVGNNVLSHDKVGHSVLFYNNKIWAIGSGDVESSTDGINWSPIQIVPYTNHSSVVFNNKMWVIGGDSDGGKKVLYSTDGIGWTEAGMDALPIPLTNHASVVFNNKIWVIGGDSGNSSKKVFSSPDGINWTESGSDVLPDEVHIHTAEVYKGEIWVIGGTNAQSNQALHSKDGINWSNVNIGLSGVNLYGHSSCIHKNKIYAFGSIDGPVGQKVISFPNDGSEDCGSCTSDSECMGYLCSSNSCTNSCMDKNDCASGNFCNGSSCVNCPSCMVDSDCSGGNVCVNSVCTSIYWAEAGMNALSLNLSGVASLAYNDKMWIFGGLDSMTGNPTKKVFSSTDGVTWTEAGMDVLPNGVSNFTSFIFNNKMWLVGGSGIGLGADVKSSTDGITWLQEGSLPVTINYPTSLIHDNKIWIIGGVSSGADTAKVFYSSNGNNWTEAGTLPLSSGSQVGKYAHRVLEYKNKMWLFGGYYGPDQVYSSTDGITWTEVGMNSLPSQLFYTGALVYDDKMWVIGGDTNTSPSKKAYSSTDGITWTERGTLPAAISNPGALVYKNKMWSIGGIGAENQVFYFPSDNSEQCSSCSMDSDCGTGFSCVNGGCVSSCKSCNADSDCPAGKGCLNGFCTLFSWAEVGMDSLPARDSQVVEFNNKLWTIGGSGFESAKVFSSSDHGVTWTEAGSNALPFGLSGHRSLVFNNKIWTIGGNTPGSALSSADGINWNQESQIGPVTDSLFDPAVVVFNNKMWLIGGNLGGGIFTNTVTSSSDGMGWTTVSTLNDYPDGLSNHAAVVFKNKIWVLGGQVGSVAVSDQAYYSSDGTTWTRGSALPLKIQEHSAIVYKDKMWIVGGKTAGNALSKKIYYTDDGSTWKEYGSDSLPADSVPYKTSIVHNNKIYILGDGGTTNKIYSFPSDDSESCSASNSCSSDGDCGNGKVCCNSSCVSGNCCTESACMGYLCSSNSCTNSCMVDGDCGMGYMCESGLCVAACTSDSDCGSNGKCCSGNCLQPNCSCSAVSMLVQNFTSVQILNYIGLPQNDSNQLALNDKVKIGNEIFTVMCIARAGQTTCGNGLSSFDIVVLTEKPSQTYNVNAAVAKCTSSCSAGTYVPEVLCCSASDCMTGGETCQSGRCINSCMVDGDCGVGYICENNSCVTACTSNSDCPNNGICQSGRCESGSCMCGTLNPNHSKCNSSMSFYQCTSAGGACNLEVYNCNNQVCVDDPVLVKAKCAPLATSSSSSGAPKIKTSSSSSSSSGDVSSSSSSSGSIKKPKPPTVTSRPGSEQTINLSDLGINFDSMTGKFSGRTNNISDRFNSTLSRVPVTVYATDGTSQSNEITFNLIVRSSNHNPSLVNPGDKIYKEGKAIVLTLLGSDEDNDTLTYYVDQLPTGLTLDKSTGVISGEIRDVTNGSDPVLFPVKAYAWDGHTDGFTQLVCFSLIINPGDNKIGKLKDKRIFLDGVLSNQDEKQKNIVLVQFSGPGSRCYSSADCESGQECKENSCVNEQDGTGGGQQCVSDSDCFPGEVCRDHLCTFNSNGGNGGGTNNRCYSDSDCDPAQKCIDFACVNNFCNPSCGPDQICCDMSCNQGSCCDDNQCESGKKCKLVSDSWQCVTETTTGSACNPSCGPDQKCCDMTCNVGTCCDDNDCESDKKCKLVSDVWQCVTETAAGMACNPICSAGHTCCDGSCKAGVCCGDNDCENGKKCRLHLDLWQCVSDSPPPDCNKSPAYNDCDYCTQCKGGIAVKSDDNIAGKDDSCTCIGPSGSLIGGPPAHSSNPTCTTCQNGNGGGGLCNASKLGKSCGNEKICCEGLNTIPTCFDGACCSNNDCMTGQRCNEHRCTENPCFSNYDCANNPNGHTCCDGACKGCCKNEDCTVGSICSDGQCKQNGTSCMGDSECKSTEACINSKCKEVECRVDSACKSTEACIDYKCKEVECKADADCSDVTASGGGSGNGGGSNLSGGSGGNNLSGGGANLNGSTDGSTKAGKDGTSGNIKDLPELFKACRQYKCVEVTCRGNDDDCKNSIAGKYCVNDSCSECKEDKHCSEGKICSANLCVNKAQCMTDFDCPIRQICSYEKCVSVECKSNLDCEKGLICSKDHKCVKELSPGYCMTKSECSDKGALCCDSKCLVGECCSTSDCPKDLTCNKDHKCVKELPAGSCMSKLDCVGNNTLCCDSKCATGNCCSNSECSPGFKCEGNLCVQSGDTPGGQTGEILSDNISPGIRFNLDSLTSGGLISGYATDEGISFYGSNSTDNIRDLRCSIDGKEAQIVSSLDLDTIFGGIKFNSSRDQKVQLPLSGTLNRWTIETLIRLDDRNLGRDQVVFKGTDIGVFVGNGLLKLQGRSADGRTVKFVSSKPLQPNTWHYITITSDGINTKLYVNGKFIGSDISIPFNFNGSLLGGDFAGNTFSGSIAKIAVYDRPLSDDEINKNNRYRLDPYDIRGLNGYWNFLETNNNTVIGYKNDNNTSTTGTAKGSSNVPNDDEVSEVSTSTVSSKPATSSKDSKDSGEEDDDSDSNKQSGAVKSSTVKSVPASGKNTIAKSERSILKAREASPSELKAVLLGFDSNYQIGEDVYYYSVKQYDVGIPIFSENELSKSHVLKCTLSDANSNFITDEFEGSFNVSSIANSLPTDPNEVDVEEPTIIEEDTTSEEVDPCCYCLSGALKCKPGIEAFSLQGEVVCDKENNLITRVGQKYIKDDISRRCVEANLLTTKEEDQKPLAAPEDEVTSDDNLFFPGSTDGGFLYTKADMGLDMSASGARLLGRTAHLAKQEASSSVYIRTSGFDDKIACKENVGKFVIKGYDPLSNIPTSFEYNSSKLTVYKVKEAEDSINLKLVTEVDTSTYLEDECTRSVQAAVAGPVIFDKSRTEIVVADSHGVNVSRSFGVNFLSKPGKIRLDEKDKVNVAPAYQGNISDVVVTPNYDGVHYLVYSKVFDKSYDHNLIFYPLADGVGGVEAGNESSGSAGDQIANAPIFLPGLGVGAIPDAAEDNDKKDDVSNNDNKDNDVDDSTEEANKGDKSPTETPQKPGDASTPDSLSDASKSDVKLDPEKGSKKDDKNNKEKKKEKEIGCNESKDCIKHGLNLFCVELKSKGVCIDPANKISKVGKVRANTCLKNEVKFQGRKKQEVFCVPTRLHMESKFDKKPLNKAKL
jgi:hypothetical protein